MSKRYGRSQKRKHREQVAYLMAQISKINNSNQRLIYEVEAHKRIANEARNEAFQEFACKHGLIADATQRISDELGRILGPQLIGPAQKVLASSRTSPKPCFDVREALNIAEDRIIVRGTINRIDYNIVLR